MKFSERFGFKEVMTTIQIDSISENLRNRLWNIVSMTLFHKAFELDLYDVGITTEKFRIFLRSMWHNFFKWQIDDIPYWESEIRKKIKYLFFALKWYELFDLIEFTFRHYKNEDYIYSLNRVLEEEMSGYRIVEWKFIQITDERELESIEKSFRAAEKYDAVSIHLKASFALMTNRTSPDYRNSIKESVSSIEALCRIVTGADGSTLGKLLNRMERENGLHPALKSSFKSLYGYTSDADGIRHSLMEKDDLSFNDAYFFFIQCSAFVHYIIELIE